MQFTRLRLNGFKSFVDPTELVISAGLTGVVGPNGCGKSNLLEALRWIMGENRPTQMRGSGMDDVIFAGSSTRSARNHAVVELVIDNSERLAPAAFNKEDRLEISRRITREIGSAYRINGQGVRARDVQMLFADASTGAQSPALVRQGQISELINAKPKARRRVLEEAAGISGLYQRRHEAELKLRATEANLARVDDVLEELSRRLAALERQAGQARRYRAIAEKLRQAEAAQLWLRWRDAEDERGRAGQNVAEAVRAIAIAEREVREATAAREGAAAELPHKREEETIAAAILQRLEHERARLDEEEQRVRTEQEQLAARARQLAQDFEREEALGRDADATLANLAEEEARLARAIEGQDLAEEEAERAAEAAAEHLRSEEAALDRLNADTARLIAEVEAAERQRADARATLGRLDAVIAGAEATLAKLGAEIETAEAATARHKSVVTAATEAAEAAEAALMAATDDEASARGAEAETRAELSAAKGEATTLSAEIATLEKILAREGGAGGGLVDGIEVAPGYEAAFGAAFGDDLDYGEAAAVAAESEAKAAAGGVAEGFMAASGWALLDAYEGSTPLPPDARPIHEFMRGPAVLTRRLGQTGLVARADGDRLQALLAPGQRLVSVEGDLWRWDGLRLRAGDAQSAAALRLLQKNRLAALRASLAEADGRRERADALHRAAKKALEDASSREGAARRQRREAEAEGADAARKLGQAEAALALARSRQDSQQEQLAARRTEREEARAVLNGIEKTCADLPDPRQAEAEIAAQRKAVENARSAAMAKSARAAELRRIAAGRARRLAEIERETARWRDRQENAGTRLSDLKNRMEETEKRQAEMADQPLELAQSRERLLADLDAAATRRKAAAEALAAAEAALKRAESAERAAEKAAGSRREERARLDAVLDAAAERADAAVDAIREARETDPDDLRATLGDDLPALAEVEAEIATLRRQRDGLGAVNLRADLDAEEVRVERDELAAEKADLDAAVDKLRRGIAELNREGRARIMAAFDNVNARFSGLFRHLFGGGEARLVMVESDDPLDAGLEILCQPPGKKLSTLSLLSGGEQTLTALSLIFAVFLSNPAPICVLDEVDAPLDDSNVGRFCDLLDEMRRRTETRFLIITHNPLTMSRMDRLFGVTMVERGVSQLVSVDLDRAAAMVEA